MQQQKPVQRTRRDNPTSGGNLLRDVDVLTYHRISPRQRILWRIVAFPTRCSTHGQTRQTARDTATVQYVIPDDTPPVRTHTHSNLLCTVGLGGGRAESPGGGPINEGPAERGMEEAGRGRGGRVPHFFNQILIKLYAGGGSRTPLIRNPRT